MKYFKNTSWLFFERIFKIVISFFVIIALTRYLGPENFGLLSYSQSFVGIFVAFATLGIDVILVRELSKSKDNGNKLIGTAFFLKLFVSIMAITIIFVLNSFIADKEAVILTIIIAFILLFQSINTIDTFFQAKVEYETVVWSDKPDGTMVQLTDPSKLNALGWKHKVELEEGIKSIYKWYLKEKI